MAEKQEQDHKSEEEGQKKDVIKRAFDFTKLKKENFVVIFLVGILLFVIAWPTENKKNSNKTTESGILDSNSGIMELAKTGSSETEGDVLLKGTDFTESGELQSYTAFLERTLEELLSSMEGAGQVKVMITLKSSGEAIVEKDMTTDRSSSTEVDSAGGSRNSSDLNEAGETVYASASGGISYPYVKQIICPKIEGVVVSAQGGDNQTVNKNITEAIQALFGIEVHKIKVIKMSSK
ncbi:MAG: stage III sporulation protein AG [Lachnospiraceae bacterium]|nr:stage III sporulation protein AG [Lachnospiraceae bacterium]